MNTDPLEKVIEGAVTKYAKEKGIAAYKFSSPSHAAVPDRMYINAKGFVWFCEFKRKGRVPTTAQKREHDRLRALNVTVYVVDNILDGKAMIDAHA